MVNGMKKAEKWLRRVKGVHRAQVLEPHRGLTGFVSAVLET